MKFLSVGLALSAILLHGPHLSAQHLNAGATAQTQGSSLIWANGAAFAAESGYVQNMTLATSGRYTGLFNASGPTLTALSSTNNVGAAAGAFLTAEIVSVAGPSGSLFSFWEGVDHGGGSLATFSILAGSTGISQQFALSDVLEGAGQPGGDPFGHLHGRRFTVNAEGLYTVGFRVLDISANGPGGSPIHLPSQVLYMNFATVPEPSVLTLAGVGLAGFWFWRRRGKV